MTITVTVTLPDDAEDDPELAALARELEQQLQRVADAAAEGKE